MRLVSVVVASLALLIPSEAFPCGAAVPAVTSEVESEATVDAQRALYEVGPDVSKTYVQLSSRANTESFAWILPVPKTANLGVGDPELFEQLDEETKPSVVVRSGSTYESGGGVGCGGASSGGAVAGSADAGTNAAEPVQRFGGGTVGDYRYDIVGGSSAQKVEAWLSENGYAVPNDLSEAISPYLEEGLAIAGVQLTGEADASQTSDPLVIERPTPQDGSFVYPLAMSSLSAPETTPVVLYTIARGQYEVGNLENHTLQDVADEVERQIERGDKKDYDAAVDTLASPDPVAVIETAWDASECEESACPPAILQRADEETPWLTRLYLRMPRGELRDIQLVESEQNTNVSRPAYIEAAKAETAAPFARAVPPTALVFLVWAALRRRNS